MFTNAFDYLFRDKQISLKQLSDWPLKNNNKKAFLPITSLSAVTIMQYSALGGIWFIALQEAKTLFCENEIMFSIKKFCEHFNYPCKNSTGSNFVPVQSQEGVNAWGLYFCLEKVA